MEKGWPQTPGPAHGDPWETARDRRVRVLGGKKQEMKTTLFPKQGSECMSLRRGLWGLSHLPVPCWSGRALVGGCGRKKDGSVT